MASTRFPGKPLAKISGIPMIGHVYYRSKLCSILNEVYIATCDREIQDYCEQIGASCVMTRDTHERASERSAEAVEKIEYRTQRKVDIVMMIQGDEPMLQPGLLSQAIEPLLEDSTLSVCNLMASITSESDFKSSNIVKVVVDLKRNALYFSREPIPFCQKFKGEVPRYKQLGLIAFRRNYLQRYVELQPTSLEVIESVDMMRVLEYGEKVKMVLVEDGSVGVDTREDLMRVEMSMKSDLLISQYVSTKNSNWTCAKE